MCHFCVHRDHDRDPRTAALAAACVDPNLEEGSDGVFESGTSGHVRSSFRLEDGRGSCGGAGRFAICPRGSFLG